MEADPRKRCAVVISDGERIGMSWMDGDAERGGRGGRAADALVDTVLAKDRANLRASTRCRGGEDGR